jgi:N-acyl-D-amino-acid deacylase
VDFDLVISKGTVVDGTGKQRFRADIGIRSGRIAAVADHERLSGAKEIDATRLIVAPGFIDIHSHSDWYLPLPYHDDVLAPMVLQGTTTMVTGQCGFSPAPVTEESVPLVDAVSEMIRYAPFSYDWSTMAEYMDAIESQGLLLNAAFLVGHGTLRYAVMGARANGGDPSPSERAAIADLARQALKEGAVGVSTGLGYEPGMYAGTQELLDLLTAIADEGGYYAPHSRSYSLISPLYAAEVSIPTNVLSTREQLELAQQAGVQLQLSHLLFHGRNTWPTYRTVLADVERAAEAGLDVAFDSFPYTFGNTTINVNFPKWFLQGLPDSADNPEALLRLKQEMTQRNKLVGREFEDITLMSSGPADLPELEGLDFAAIARRLDLSEFDSYVYVARASRGKATIMMDTYSGDANSEEPLRAILAHPRCAFMLDAFIARQGKQNAAAFGAFPRLLGHYSRDLGLLSLEETVRKMTSFSAQRIGFNDIGEIAEGKWADLVLFDPETIADNTTKERPDAPPTGIHSVLISGHVVARQGRLLGDVRRGRVLRR